jgi:phospholipid/cholesterol/gamma-HCH transport system permease protein
MPGVTAFFEAAGDMGSFGFRALREAFRPPFEIAEITNQIFEAGWRSAPLVLVCGLAVGVVLSLQTRAAIIEFGAEALIPEVTVLAMVRDMGPLLVGLLVAGRVGAGIGAELSGMRVTEQIDALESLAIDSYKYLVVTRILACIVVMPILTTMADFAGLVGGFLGETVTSHISFQLYVQRAFANMNWYDFLPATLKTVVFGFIIGTISTFLGYNAQHGSSGIGQASTRSVVYSSLLLILADVLLVKIIFFWFPQAAM